MDIFHINYDKVCIVCLKRPKINEKEADDGQFKNNWKENETAKIWRRSFIGLDPQAHIILSGNAKEKERERD